MNDNKNETNGRISRGSIRSFTCAFPLVGGLDGLMLGGLVVVEKGDTAGYKSVGLITDIDIVGDALTERLAINSNLPQAVVHDQRDNRTAVVLVTASVVGYQNDKGAWLHTFAPIPALVLADTTPMTVADIKRFAMKPGYITLLLDMPSPTIPLPYVLAAHISYLAEVYESITAPAILEVIKYMGDHFSNSDPSALIAISRAMKATGNFG